MYQTLREPPAKGSLRESILIVFIMKQQQIVFMRDFALAQVIANKKFDIFEDYQKEMFPWLETAKKRERIDHIKRLMEEVKRGPIGVKSIGSPSVRSRMKNVKRVEVTDDVRRKQNELYSRLGSMF